MKFVISFFLLFCPIGICFPIILNIEYVRFIVKLIFRIMKKVLLIIISLISITSFYAQTSQLNSIFPTYNNGGNRPLEGKEYDYTISMSGGSYATGVSLRCTNGVFTINNSSVYNTYATNSFSLKVKWGNAGRGEIYGEDNSGYRTSYVVNIEKPEVFISGPSSAKYGDVLEYTLSANPSISISSANWGNSAEFNYVSGQGTSKYKVKVIKNESKSVSNAITVTAQTDYGVLSTIKLVSIEPVFKIYSNESVVCNGENVTYFVNTTGPTPISWQAGNNMTLVSGQESSTPIFKASGNNFGVVKATLTSGGKSYNVENSQVWIGAPKYNESADNNQLTQYRDLTETFMLTAPFYGNPTIYEWKVNGTDLSSRYINDDAGTISILFKYLPVGVYEYSVKATNACGTSLIRTFLVTIVADPDEVPILKSSTTIGEESPKSIKIYSINTGSLMYTEKGIINFNIENVPLNKGVYLIESVDDKGNVVREKVVKRF